MGQKIQPFAYRLGITKGWSSRWFPIKKNFKNQLEEDCLIRKIIQKRIAAAGIVRIDIERGAHNAYRIYIKAAKPGLIIGRGGKGIEELSKAIENELKSLFHKRGTAQQKLALSLNVEELKRTEISALYMGQSIAWDLEKRLPARRVMKKYMELIMQNRDVKGAKIKLSGRIDGAEISRRESISKGSLPLTTLRADIDYGEARALCSYGYVGIKVWLYKGEIFNKTA